MFLGYGGGVRNVRPPLSGPNHSMKAPVRLHPCLSLGERRMRVELKGGWSLGRGMGMNDSSGIESTCPLPVLKDLVL